MRTAAGVAVLRQQLVAILAQVFSAGPRGIRPVAHLPFPQNPVEGFSIDPIGVVEVHPPRHARPVLRVRRRIVAWLDREGQRQSRAVENRRWRGRKRPCARL